MSLKPEIFRYFAVERLPMATARLIAALCTEHDDDALTRTGYHARMGVFPIAAEHKLCVAMLGAKNLPAPALAHSRQLGENMTDDEIIALAHKYIEFDQGKIDGATLNAELAKCRDTGELIAVGTASKMLKGGGLVISSDTPDNPLYDRSKQIASRLTGSVKENVGIDPLNPLKSWGDLRGMPRDITGDLAV